jgi:Ni,Fe-hydrogenase III large subunit
VRGRDTYQIAVGPIHAGVIESGHFRFHAVGDRILHVDARLFYKHRGLETAAEGTNLSDGMPYVSRACAACSTTNAVAYADGCEQVRGLQLVRSCAGCAPFCSSWNGFGTI